jgi:cytoskeleton protein RodZ
MMREEPPASDTPATGETGKGPGARLRAARERLGLSLQQVADRLRLNPSVIEGIEADNYTGLGAPVYVRGHLRRVADLVGESGSEIEALFRNGGSNHGMPDLTRIVTQKYRIGQQSPRLGTWPTVIIGALILIGGLVWWAMQQAPRASSGSQVIEIPVTQTGAAPGAPASSVADAQPAAQEPGSAPAGTISVGPGAVSAGPEPGAVNAGSQPAAMSGTQAAASNGRPPLAPNATISPSLSKQPIPRAAVSGDKLALHFREDSWVEAYSADGTRLFYDVGSAGTQHDLAGPGPWRLVLGNADGVTLVVNGRTVTLGRTLRETPNAHLTLDRTGRVSESQ